MNRAKLNIGIVGCGTIAEIHAKAISASTYLNLISAFSRNTTNLEKITNSYNAKGFSDIDKFLKDSELQAVSICTPSGTHLDYAGLAAEAEKHVIIEKPIEVNLPRAKKIIDKCKERDVKLAVIYQNRFIKDVVKMKRVLDTGEIGKIFLADAYVKWFRSQTYYNSAEWRGTMKLDGGGVLINQAIHTVDLLLWLAGEIETLYAQTGTFTHQNLEGEDNAAAVLKFKNGAIGALEASTSIKPAFKRKIEIHGEKGTAVLEGDKFRLLSNNEDLETNEDKSSNAGGADPLAGFSIEPHKLQFEQIAEAIKNNLEPVVSGEESLKSLAIVKSIYESAKLNMPININDFINKEIQK